MSLLWKWILPAVVVVFIAWLAQKHDGEGYGESPKYPQPTSTSQVPSTETSTSSTNAEQQEDDKKNAVVYVIGDLHGDVHCAKYWVDRVGLINQDNGQWVDSSHHLVFVGDYIDKGPTSKQTMEFVKSLTDQYPSQVTAIMGNHEMELLLDRDERRHDVWGGMAYYQLAYSSVHPGEYRNFIPQHERVEEDELVIEALYNASIEVYGVRKHRDVVLSPTRTDEDSIINYIKPELRTLVQERMAVFQKRYIDAFRTGTELGTWLEQRPVAALIDGTLFVHGGISSGAAQVLAHDQGLDWLNQQLSQHATEDKLLDFIQGTHMGKVVYSMLTFRGNHQRKACPHVPALLPAGASRLSVGHTPDDTVRLLCNQQVLAVDSALGRWFRNSGNDYCPGHTAQHSTNGRYKCQPINEACEGQIVRIQNNNIEIIES